MSTRIKGRDFNSLRDEFISYVRTFLGESWNPIYPNDPMVCIVECLAALGEQLHYYIDQTRNECDLATARLRTSVYSYAIREGYPLGYPKASSCDMALWNVHSVFDSVQPQTPIRFSLKRMKSVITLTDGYFLIYTGRDREVVLNPYGNIEGVSSSQNLYPYNDPSASTVIHFVLSQSRDLSEFSFTMADIDLYSRVRLPSALIDCGSVQLLVLDMANGNTSDWDDAVEWHHSDDIISRGDLFNSYSLVPQFINGIEYMFIEFPCNYKRFITDTMRFKFVYIPIVQTTFDKEDIVTINSNALDFMPSEYRYEDDFDYMFLSSCKGYSDFESVDAVKENFWLYNRSLKSLVTLDDFKAYVQLNYATDAFVYDWKSNDETGLDLKARQVLVIAALEVYYRKQIMTNIRTLCSRDDDVRLARITKVPYDLIIYLDIQSDNVDIKAELQNIEAAIQGYYVTDLYRTPIESYIEYIIHRTSNFVTKCDIAIFPYPQPEYTVNGSGRVTYMSVNGIADYFYDYTESNQASMLSGLVSSISIFGFDGNPYESLDTTSEVVYTFYEDVAIDADHLVDSDSYACFQDFKMNVPPYSNLPNQLDFDKLSYEDQKDYDTDIFPVFTGINIDTQQGLNEVLNRINTYIGLSEITSPRPYLRNIVFVLPTNKYKSMIGIN